MELKLPPEIFISDLVNHPRITRLRNSMETYTSSDAAYYSGYRDGYGGLEHESRARTLENQDNYDMGYEDGQADRWEELKS